MDESDLEFELSVVKRPSIQGDLPLVFSTWRNQAFYGSPHPHTQPSKIFFKKQTELIKQILAKSTLTVACLESDPDLLVGYCVHSNTHLHWVYVKKDYRNKGIATLLVPKSITSCDQGLTETGNMIAKRMGWTTTGSGGDQE